MKVSYESEPMVLTGMVSWTISGV